MRLPHPRAMGALLRKDERRNGATSQIELNPLRSPGIAQISLKSATKKRAADTSSLQSMKSSYAAYEAHGGAKSVGPAPYAEAVLPNLQGHQVTSIPTGQ